ncbi:MAG: Fic family protein [Chloroflexi bacterium]|nr:Fic family protein [Chloroflexota bacterium]
MPDPLPREMALSTPLIVALDKASRAVATLAGVGETIPNPTILVRPFMRREAVLSSSIEGTYASLSDLFLYEASDETRPRGDVREVANYVRALERGLDLLNRLPISLRLINQVHERLLRGVRDEDKRPGELRTEQVHIGVPGTPIEEARYVPPPADVVRDLLLDWERFANEDTLLPPLIACAMVHYQFEAIHPYLDGNGRVGRLLIILFLCAKGVLPAPLLYLSAYFERHREEYYDHLFAVSATGDWKGWLSFFFAGVEQQSRDAIARIKQMRSVHERYMTIAREHHLSGSATRLLEELVAGPFMTAPRASALLNISNPGAHAVLDKLAAAGILEPVPNSWPRLYVAREVLHALEASSAL